MYTLYRDYILLISRLKMVNINLTLIYREHIMNHIIVIDH